MFVSFFTILRGYIYIPSQKVIKRHGVLRFKTERECREENGHLNTITIGKVCDGRDCPEDS